ncbi:MAG: hypothetical protein WD491_00355 [Balneolales bacterium]
MVRGYISYLPFIICSGYIGEDEAVEIIKKGASDYILKDRLLRLSSSVQRELESYDVKQQQKADEQRYRKLIQISPEQFILVMPMARFCFIIRQRLPFGAENPC